VLTGQRDKKAFLDKKVARVGRVCSVTQAQMVPVVLMVRGGKLERKVNQDCQVLGRRAKREILEIQELMAYQALMGVLGAKG